MPNFRSLEFSSGLSVHRLSVVSGLSAGATKAGVVSGFEWLSQKVQPADRMIFYFSGHGTQTQGLDGDEADSRDEVLCTYEIEVDNRPTYLLDDELRLGLSGGAPPATSSGFPLLKTTAGMVCHFNDLHASNRRCPATIS
jgi:hypothetical protein